MECKVKPRMGHFHLPLQINEVQGQVHDRALSSSILDQWSARSSLRWGTFIFHFRSMECKVKPRMGHFHLPYQINGVQGQVHDGALPSSISDQWSARSSPGWGTFIFHFRSMECKVKSRMGHFHLPPGWSRLANFGYTIRKSTYNRSFHL